MKKYLTIIFLLFSFCSLADQLAYITKLEAERAVEFISNQKTVYLFCGCCSLVEPEKIKVRKVYYKYTNYEQFYEVFIQYKDKSGEIIDKAFDLAYVWVKKKKRYKTIGRVLGLDHDPCVQPEDWNSPKYIEEDI